MATIEICVDSLESALAAAAGGADRLEICSALSTGGLTPSLGFLRAVRARVSAALYVMIRPRTGDFLYSAEELAIMRQDIALARDAGADGVVFGVLDEDGSIDESATRDLVRWASPMQGTFHRAFDRVPDLEAGLETLIRTGVHRVLTSGGARTAWEGRLQLANLVRSAKDRISVMPGGGVRAENVEELAGETGAHEFHAALRRSLPHTTKHLEFAVSPSDSGTDEYVRHVVRASDVRALKLSVDGSAIRFAAPDLSSY